MGDARAPWSGVCSRNTHATNSRASGFHSRCADVDKTSTLFRLLKGHSTLARIVCISRLVSLLTNRNLARFALFFDTGQKVGSASRSLVRYLLICESHRLKPQIFCQTCPLPDSEFAQVHFPQKLFRCSPTLAVNQSLFHRPVIANSHRSSHRIGEQHSCRNETKKAYSRTSMDDVHEACGNRARSQFHIHDIFLPSNAEIDAPTRTKLHSSSWRG